MPGGVFPSILQRDLRKEVMSEQKTSYADVRVLLVLLASAGVIILGCLVLNGFTWSRLQDSANGQAQALDRLAQYSAVLSTLQDVELGSRGYVITGSDYHLEIFNRARDQFAREWELLVELEAENEVENDNLRAIRTASDNLIRYAIEIALVRERDGGEAASQAFISNRPRFALRTVRDAYHNQMKLVEAVIRQRHITAERDFQAGLATSMAMGLLALGIGAISIFLLKRVFKEMRRSERYALSMLESEESRRQKDIFLAMMSHEIRTPLNAIIGFGQLAQQQDMGIKGQRYVQSILDGGQSLLLLINDILDLSKLQSGRMVLKPEPTNVNDMLEFLQRLFQESATKKGIGFKVEVQENLPTTLLLDSVRLRQVLMNLIGNAVKFTEKGRVLIRVGGKASPRQSNKWNLVIKVADTGPGIPEDELAHIFEPFYQSNRSDSFQSKGTGLGLSIVNNFIELMGGSLKVSSEVGKGSVFTVRLRNVSVSPRLAADNRLSSDKVDFNLLKPSKILAVDDNATNLELIAEIFSDTHHTVVTAKDGVEAFERIREVRPDLVLMDLRMPVKDGPTVAREIKTNKEYQLMPIIAVTAGSLPDGEERPLQEANFDGALRKPFSRKEMYEALADFLDKNDGSIQEATTEIMEDLGTASPDLQRDLAEILEDKWQGVRARMSVSEVVEFSDELVQLAEVHPNQKLVNYAEKLKEAAESFSFREMEQVLERFPQFVRELSDSK